MSAKSKKPVTRRGIVSVVYSLYDPLGFIAPYIMKAKLILQMLSRKKIGWDEPLEENDNVQWTRWLDDLGKLKEVTVDRCFKPKGFTQVQEIQLHLFSDASWQGYSAAAYFRLKDVDGRVHCSFVMGKARLAPISEISTPRLELTAAVISVKLSHVIRDELDLTVNKVIYWTDSTSVLKCIKNETKRFHTFESNRLTIIHDGSTPQQWRYVNREDNPADDGSKGLKLDVLTKNDRWLTGPKFLWEEEECWPAMVEILILKDDDPEVRKEHQIYVASARRDVMEELMMYYSSWWKLKVAVSWLLRYKRYLKNKIKNKAQRKFFKQARLRGEKWSPHTWWASWGREWNCPLCSKERIPRSNCPSIWRKSKAGEEANKEYGSFVKQVEPSSPWRIVASRRPYWTSPFVLRLETPSNFALQASYLRPDNQGPPPESGTHGPRVSFVVVETEVLDLEREICSGSSAEQMFWLSEAGM